MSSLLFWVCAISSEVIFLFMVVRKNEISKKPQCFYGRVYLIFRKLEKVQKLGKVMVSKKVKIGIIDLHPP